VDQVNEDFVSAEGHVLVVVDGAGIRGAEYLCQHGVAWYARTLGNELVERLLGRPVERVRDVVAESIRTVTAAHSDTCAVGDPSSPQASVAVVRRASDRVEYLVLGDAFVLLETAPPRVITDERERAVRDAATHRLKQLTPGTEDYERERHRAIETMRARRNHHGGYWIAKDDPRAAHEAVVGSIDVESGACVAVLSNGAARLVEPYRVTGWQGVLETLHSDGPDGVLRNLRDSEGRTGEAPDDASIAYMGRAH
jgi:hypothetical protein